MGYEFKLEECLSAGVPRILREQLNRAHTLLCQQQENQEIMVHGVRKCFKKLRGVMELLRFSIKNEQYKTEKSCFRAAARHLSEVRDSKICIRTIDSLKAHYQDRIENHSFSVIRQRFVQSHERLEHKVFNEQNILQEISDTITQSLERINIWKVSGINIFQIVRGLESVYKKGKDAMKLAYSNPSAENFHVWRKWAKYFWYHVRLFKAIWPRIFKPMSKELQVLTDSLGLDHDLAQLKILTLLGYPNGIGEEGALLFELIESRQNELRSDARLLGERLYLNSPFEMKNLIKNYWEIWKRNQSVIFNKKKTEQISVNPH